MGLKLKLLSDLMRGGAVGVHDPDFHAAGAVGLEGEALAIGKPRGSFVEIGLATVVSGFRGVGGEFAGVAGGSVEEPDVGVVFLRAVDLNGELGSIGRPHGPLGIAGAGREVTELALVGAIGVHDEDGEFAVRSIATGEGDAFAVGRPVIVPGDGGTVVDLTGIRTTELGQHQPCGGPGTRHVEELFPVG